MQSTFISSSCSLTKPIQQVKTSSVYNKSRSRLIQCNAEQEGSTNANAAATCPTCGVPKSEMSMGCDGSGRIMGGIGAVPGFGWWPIKAYRPCGKATAAGISYKRKGQVVDEVLFGRGGPDNQ